MPESDAPSGRSTAPPPRESPRLHDNELMRGAFNTQLGLATLPRRGDQPLSPFALLMIVLDRARPDDALIRLDAAPDAALDAAPYPGTSPKAAVLDRVRACLATALRSDDRFVVLDHGRVAVQLPSQSREGNVRRAAERVLGLLRLMDLTGFAVSVDPAAGCALFPQDGVDPDALLRAATRACQKAALLGTGCEFSVAP